MTIEDRWLGRLVIRAVMDGGGIHVRLAASAAVVALLEPMVPGIKERFRQEGIDLHVELEELEQDGGGREQAEEKDEPGGGPCKLDLLA